MANKSFPEGDVTDGFRSYVKKRQNEYMPSAKVCDDFIGGFYQTRDADTDALMRQTEDWFFALNRKLEAMLKKNVNGETSPAMKRIGAKIIKRRIKEGESVDESLCRIISETKKEANDQADIIMGTMFNKSPSTSQVSNEEGGAAA